MRKIKIVTLLMISFLFTCFYVTASAQEWKKIVPLKTNCEDLKKTLGVKECDYPVSSYKFEKFTVNIQFSRKGDGWDVSSDTVVDVTIILHQLIELKDFETDFTDYTKKPESDYPALIYRNEKRGVEFETQKPEGDEEYIMSVSFFPVKTKKKNE